MAKGDELWAWQARDNNGDWYIIAVSVNDSPPLPLIHPDKALMQSPGALVAVENHVLNLGPHAEVRLACFVQERFIPLRAAYDAA